MKMLNTIHPRKWWECFGDHCPILQKLAVRILSQTCAAPICNLFKLQPNDSIDTLRMNMIMRETFSTLESQNWEPINLDKISGIPEYAHEVIKQYFEEMDWSDEVDSADLLAISNPNNQVLSPSEPNACDDLFELSDTLRELGVILDDELDMINQYY
ncbi:hypothetical protein ACOSQ3_003507 [Xanthoceras sorbifolium]